MKLYGSFYLFLLDIGEEIFILKIYIREMIDSGMIGIRDMISGIVMAEIGKSVIIVEV